MARGDRANINLNTRFKISVIIAGALFFLLILRLWYLQILKGDFFREKSENNRLRTIYLPPPRGLILDRNGSVLVKNRPGFNVELVSEDSPNPKQTVQQLSKVLGLNAEELIPKLGGDLKRRRYEPKLLLKDVSRDIVAKVLSRRYMLPGIEINVIPTRDYINGNFASHVLGYIREITKEQLVDSMYQGYRQGDLVGQFGIENKLEQYLQGQRGSRVVIVDATGNRFGEAWHEPEIGGSNVTLTLDLDVQRAADKALDGKKGAIVALNANTGEVIAMTSKPDFDPNLFNGEITPEIWQSLGGKEKRLSNRAVQGGYPPGSVFKIFMAVAALSEGVTNGKERINCPGGLFFSGRTYRCHKKGGHGPVDLHESIVQSCDVFFYTLGQRMGVDTIHRYATLFGLGASTKLDLVPENPGLVPSTEWKSKAFRKKEDQKWYAGETLSVAIGQGAVVTTPLQIARAMAAVVNGGKVMRPYLIKEISGVVDKKFEPIVDKQLDFKEEIVKYVKDSMQGVVNEPRGTGRRSQLDKDINILVGGKTGTSQVVSLSSGSTLEHHADHAWFAAYAPTDNPEIVVSVLVENGGSGGASAAPVAKQVLDAYFRKKLGLPPAPTVEESATQNTNNTVSEQESAD